MTPALLRSRCPRLAVALAAGLSACNSGPNEETLVDELRVLATLSTTPEAQPGERVDLEAFVVDPKDDGYDVMSWVCTTTGEDCLEAAATGGGAWDGLRAEASPDQPWFSSSLQVPPFFAEFVDEQPLPLIFHYTLACLPGRCAALELALAEPAAGSPEAKQLAALLADPAEMMTTLPMDGVSLALRRLTVSTRAPGARVDNPTFSVTTEGGAPLPAELTAGDELGILFSMEGPRDEDAAVWLYTDVGGFRDANAGLADPDEVPKVPYYAPDEAQDLVNLWFIAVNGDGGVSFGSHALRVNAAE
jgi:hypothetical protein